MAAKSLKSFRKTVALTTLARLEPAASRMALRFSRTRVVLFGDAAGDDLLGGGVERNLAGGEDEAPHTHALRVGADGGRSRGGCDDGFAHGSIVNRPAASEVLLPDGEQGARDQQRHQPVPLLMAKSL